ncbi:nitrous oxide reductase accessory protein NosL [Arcticibacterium luteifluviistationis]|nr:nitrous oxide reductase accessory protein NosL [Arcticibacterium luteifluviistationis]
MKATNILYLLLFSLGAFGQKQSACSLCKMDISDVRFMAFAEIKNTKLSFDAAECLVNYIKLNTEAKNLQVTDYQTGNLIEATSAFYLKSADIPSPMGANISAYATEKAAQSMQKQKGGEVMNWDTLQKRFKSSKFGSNTESHHHHSSRPDIYGPTGIMGDHLHGKGGKMLSVKYMTMPMNGNRSSSKLIEDEAVFANYMVSPQQMNMQMFMISGMYAISDKVTLMAMQNFRINNMTLTHKMVMEGMPMYHDFETKATGFGDLNLNTLIGLISKENYSFHLNTGLSVPLGSISNRDKTPMSESAKLPYAMQLGSGTYDATIGGTLRGSREKSSWGIQHLSTFRMGKNQYDYNLGDLHQMNLWTTHSLTSKLSTSLRINATVSGAINGKDDELMPMMVPTAKGSNYERQIIRAFAGINSFTLTKGILASAEIGLPVFQHSAGVFMDETFTLNTGLRFIL